MKRKLNSGMRTGSDIKIPLWRNIYLLLLTVVLVLIFSSGCSQATFQAEDSTRDITAYFDQYIPELLDQYQVPGISIGIIRGGKLVWSGAYGFADINAQQPMTVDLICRAESISKSVTAWGVMALVEQGLVNLDDPVQQYLGDFRLPDSRFAIHDITVRNLLSQTSGISLGRIGEEYPPQSHIPSLKEYLANEIDVINNPGADFEYSNTNYNLLELLIEEVTGQDFAGYMNEQVLGPLGMHNSSYIWQEHMAGSIPIGYDLQGNPVPPYVYPAQGSGGLFSTAEDLARFVAAGMEAPDASGHLVLGEESIGDMYSPKVAIPGLFGIVADGYGFGHFIESLPNDRKAVWHGGQGHGWMTHFHSVPETGDGIVIITNSQRSWPLIAKVLTAWARWNGVGSVKFGRITHGAIVMRAFILAVVLISVWEIYRLMYGLRSGNRKWAPLSSASWIPRLLQASLGIGGIAVLGWSAAQPYLFLTSIFPITAKWAGLSLSGLSLILIGSAMFPSHGVE